ncbi:MAG TPA: DNA methylase [Deltaproteobacteria bacterium]|nr:DNA methylase [Deltaproteobacteria bacterium]
MHMAWVRHVCGRIKSDYRYSGTLVYNNFPWPDPADGQKDAISRAAQDVLDVRAKFPRSTLADLYDPIRMPPELARAHSTLDKTVDKAYGKTAFSSEMERVAFLFERYEALTRPILPPTRSVSKRRGGGGRKR